MFKPTYLYIKRHKVTGLLYFGKTAALNPLSYSGSGKYWRAHLKKHGKEIETLWHRLFEDEDALKKFARRFSSIADIVKSEKWANVIPENGLDGGPPGMQHSLLARKNMSKAKMGKKMSPQHKANSAKAKSKSCTVDGIKIYPKVVDLIAALGQGRNGLKHPNFHYMENYD